ncbi:MAG: efflux RND transporter periplasmic adaptor subunit [Chitinophagaceae bacterium]|nr:efflux RND transporter periplasmic adaptor subunit [Chitinophagaceae bacterium]
MFSNKLLITGLVIAAAITIASCSGDQEKKEAVKEQPVNVTLSVVSSANVQAVLASGQVEAMQTANISTRMMGRITNIFVKAGDRVSKGQLLVTISDEDMKAKRAQTSAMIAEAEAAYAASQKDYERFNNLYKEQSATAKELDNVTLQYNSAKERVNAARQMRNEVNAMLAYSSLTAPFAGVVTQKLAEAGGIASPGVPLLTVEQNGVLQVSAAVAESDISNIKLGDVASLQIKSTGKIIQGNIIQLNPSSQFTGGQYIVKISIPEADKRDLYAGMFVSVSIPLKENVKQVDGDAVMVPLSAIVNREELTGIYTVSNNNTALLRWIRLGKTYGDKVEVISGLSNDEQFILSAEGKLYNGAAVRVSSK